jgi:hypothetical protein
MGISVGLGSDRSSSMCTADHQCCDSLVGPVLMHRQDRRRPPAGTARDGPDPGICADLGRGGLPVLGEIVRASVDAFGCLEG